LRSNQKCIEETFTKPDGKIEKYKDIYAECRRIESLVEFITYLERHSVPELHSGLVSSGQFVTSGLFGTAGRHSCTSSNAIHQHGLNRFDELQEMAKSDEKHCYEFLPCMSYGGKAHAIAYNRYCVRK